MRGRHVKRKRGEMPDYTKEQSGRESSDSPSYKPPGKSLNTPSDESALVDAVRELSHRSDKRTSARQTQEPFGDGDISDYVKENAIWALRGFGIGGFIGIPQFFLSRYYPPANYWLVALIAGPGAVVASQFVQNDNLTTKFGEDIPMQRAKERAAGETIGIVAGYALQYFLLSYLLK